MVILNKGVVKEIVRLATCDNIVTFIIVVLYINFYHCHAILAFILVVLSINLYSVCTDRVCI